MRPLSGVLALVPLLSGAPLHAQAPTLEQRVALLEQRVRRLDSLHGIARPLPVVLPPDVPAQVRGSEQVRWGYPGGAGTLLVKADFLILHDDVRKVPVWVAYRLTRQDLATARTRAGSFRPDTALPKGRRAELVDYRYSGYQRGHMAPSADFTRDSAAMAATYVLSNVAPQRPSLNHGAWQRVETQLRTLVRERCDAWIVTGTLYLDSLMRPAAPAAFIGPDSVAVPTHFYKAILCEHRDGVHEMFAFVMPNPLDPVAGKPRAFLVSVAEVQRLSGLDLFAALPAEEQRRLEAARDTTSWPLK